MKTCQDDFGTKRISRRATEASTRHVSGIPSAEPLRNMIPVSEPYDHDGWQLQDMVWKDTPDQPPCAAVVGW